MMKPIVSQNMGVENALGGNVLHNVCFDLVHFNMFIALDLRQIWLFVLSRGRKCMLPRIEERHA